MAGLITEIRTSDLSITKQECCLLSLLDFCGLRLPKFQLDFSAMREVIKDRILSWRKPE